MKKVLVVILSIAVFVVAYSLTKYLFADKTTTNLTKEQYLKVVDKNCEKQKVSKQTCSCVYNKIINQYGVEATYQMDKKAAYEDKLDDRIIQAYVSC